MRRRTFLQLAASSPLVATAAQGRPNIIQILIDDMGYADLGCYGGRAATPNLDKLAGEGIRFTQAYVASPVCSPSRVGIMTGQFPARQMIYSYLDTREVQRKHRMPNFLSLQAPSVPRQFQKAGYATGHFGKWHMGGGRDVGEAPLPTEYGFDESLTSFEGLGDRVLPPGRLSELNEKLGRGQITHAPQQDLTRQYVDRTLAFMERSRSVNKNFYIHLWPNEVHDPFDAPTELMKKYERFSANPYEQQYYATIESMDRQLGRVIDAVDQMGLAEQTLIIALSDNGPTAWPRYYNEKKEPPGSTGGLRGRKWSLYEGGIRVPFIARWKSHIPDGHVDETSVVSSVDLMPTCCALAQVPLPAAAMDGENIAGAFAGTPRRKRKDLFFDYGRDDSYQMPGLKKDQSPNLAIRSGPWKLLQNSDGSRRELYDLSRDRVESQDLSKTQLAVSNRLSRRLLDWHRSLPVLRES